jgi:activator of HSP90 ATPase
MKTKTLKQTATIPATPKQVYAALMDSKQHAAFTGEKAEISRVVGGKFSAWGGYCYGKNLELTENKKIVQSWRASDWPKDALSQITYSLAKSPQGTKLTFVQTGLPADQYEDIKKGWTDFYWEPLKKYFTK